MDDQMKVWEGTVLTIPNHHLMCCGKPPELVADGSVYTAYFENQRGEQLVFQFDYKVKKGTLWHGDYGWEHLVTIMGGGTTMLINEEEREWLQLVWRIATRRETKEFQLRSALELVNALKATYSNLIAHLAFKDDTRMQDGFRKTMRKLEKEEKAILEELESLGAVEEAEKIVDTGENEP